MDTYAILWRGEDATPCLCKLCTPEAEHRAFYGELCPGCETETFDDVEDCPGWLICVICKFMIRDAGVVAELEGLPGPSSLSG